MKASPIRCLITAGPTREFFDPVRFLSNPSTGKMGYALASAAAEAGWEVTLVSGPVSIPAPPGVRLVPVVTGQEMLAAVSSGFPECRVLIMTAAVMDYRPATFSTRKLKKTGAPLTIALEPVPDILKTVTARRGKQFVVGFAAETNEIEAYARAKLREKGCDWMVANRVGQAEIGRASCRERVSVCV